MMFKFLFGWWCDTFHDRCTVPMHGKYTCLVCHREITCEHLFVAPDQDLVVRRAKLPAGVMVVGAVNP